LKKFDGERPATLHNIILIYVAVASYIRTDALDLTTS